MLISKLPGRPARVLSRVCGVVRIQRKYSQEATSRNGGFVENGLCIHRIPLVVSRPGVLEDKGKDPVRLLRSWLPRDQLQKIIFFVRVKRAAIVLGLSDDLTQDLIVLMEFEDIPTAALHLAGFEVEGYHLERVLGNVDLTTSGVGQLPFRRNDD